MRLEAGDELILRVVLGELRLEKASALLARTYVSVPSDEQSLSERIEGARGDKIIPPPR